MKAVRSLSEPPADMQFLSSKLPKTPTLEHLEQSPAERPTLKLGPMANRGSLLGVLAVVLGLPLAAYAKDAEFVLNDDHETFQWRAIAGRPPVDQHRAVVWTRHEQVKASGTQWMIPITRPGDCSQAHPLSL